ncbi:hypothetical protein F5Y06DRAFT_283645 [Hypoxylon sp. FL0890]|nr:hypothetical protein F5Y06DRAFT_283645 [Hypoxylon sp. FL0890]
MCMPSIQLRTLIPLLGVVLALFIPVVRRHLYLPREIRPFQVYTIDRRHMSGTDGNPQGGDDTMDAIRCATLHNTLVEHAWVAEGHRLEELDRRSFFQYYGDAADELRDRLDPALALFLELTITSEDLPAFFYWVSGLMLPNEMFLAEEMFPEDERDRFVVLYRTNTGIVGHALGLVYDQKLHRATMALAIEDIDITNPVDEHGSLWHPLGAVLENWLHMIEIGKITASQNETCNEKYGPWTWHPYSATQVDSTVAAFERLTTAIEDRMSPNRLLDISSGPLLSDTNLDAASVPQECFIRQFLTRARRPRFKTIAPGLEVPLDPDVFLANQKFTVMNARSEYGDLIPPVLIFASTERRTVNFDSPSRYVSINPFCRIFADLVPRGDESTPAGLYSESVERWTVDNSEDGFRLVLPFRFRTNNEEDGARKSDGWPVGKHSVADLFQHGFKPFGGEWWRAQRLERLFDKWRELIESGVWGVGHDGVQGSIDTFRDAATGRWSDYWIEPTW